MAHQVTRTTYPEGPDAPCRGQPDLYAVAVSGAHLAHCHDHYAGPCADAISDALPHQQIGQQIHGHLTTRNQS